MLCTERIKVGEKYLWCSGELSPDEHDRQGAALNLALSPILKLVMPDGCYRRTVLPFFTVFPIHHPIKIER